MPKSDTFMFELGMWPDCGAVRFSLEPRSTQLLPMLLLNFPFFVCAVETMLA